MAWRPAPPSLIALFDAVLPADSSIERRRMFGYPAAFVGGRLFAGLHQEDLILKLSPEDRERIERDFGARPFVPMPGRTMREYRVVPPELLEDAASLRTWMLRSLAFVAGLGPSTVSAKRTAKRRRSSKRAR